MSIFQSSKSFKHAFWGATLLSVVIASIGIFVIFFGERYHLRLVYASYVNLLVVLGLQVFMGNTNITNLKHIRTQRRLKHLKCNVIEYNGTTPQKKQQRNQNDKTKNGETKNDRPRRQRNN